MRYAFGTAATENQTNRLLPLPPGSPDGETAKRQGC